MLANHLKGTVLVYFFGPRSELTKIITNEMAMRNHATSVFDELLDVRLGV